MEPLLTLDDELVSGTVGDRPNRFVVRVRFEDAPKRVFPGDPGALEGILEPGRSIRCSPVDDPDGATDYDAIAVRVDEILVSVRATLANVPFERALACDAIPEFTGYTCRKYESAVLDHGRTDFLLETPNGDSAYVEVKSWTHVEDGVATFPDRQTERGRRHLRSLEALRDDGYETHVVFVVQRPNVDCFRPYREVDPEFAELLIRVRETGVEVHAITTAFESPHYWLRSHELPVELD